MKLDAFPGAGPEAAKWAKTVRAEHEQTDRVRSDNPDADHWKKLAHRFAPATRDRAFQDETFQAIKKYVRPDDTVLDVGAGAGRLALPLADICRHVTAVEPSEAMQARLTEQADGWGLDNLSVVASTWEDAEADAADVVICAHVVYTVRNISEFLGKLSQHAQREVIVVLFEQPAMANYFELWKKVYGEERIPLPSLSELKKVLEEMHVSFDTEPLSEWQSRPFADFDSAYEESLARLFITPIGDNSGLTNKVRSVLEETLEPVEDGLLFKWARPHRPWLVRWST